MQVKENSIRSDRELDFAYKLAPPTKTRILRGGLPPGHRGYFGRWSWYRRADKQSAGVDQYRHYYCRHKNALEREWGSKKPRHRFQNRAKIYQTMLWGAGEIDVSSPTLKYQDRAWDFRTADTKEFTHCFHAYPAMMIPQIARELLRRYGQRGGWLLDPYCGTGTSLVEASLFGMHSVGCDINPLVRLIATSKLAPVALPTIDHNVRKLHTAMSRIKRTVPTRTVPDITNLTF